MMKREMADESMKELVRIMHRMNMEQLPVKESLEGKYQLSDLFYKKMDRVVSRHRRRERFRKITGMAAAAVACMLFICIVTVIMQPGSEEAIEKNPPLEKLTLNHIGELADEYEIKSVKIANDLIEQLPDTVPVYKVKAREYTDSDIENIMKESVNSKIIECEDVDDTRFYTLSNGGYVIYYENSGTISYRLNKEDNTIQEGKSFTDEQLVKIARQFIDQTHLYNSDELSLYKVQPSMTAEYADDGDNVQILEYEVVYLKIPPEDIDGFAGTGPGIILDIDSMGEVVGFVSVDKEIELVETEYPAKTEAEIESDIIDNNNVLIYSQDEIDENIDLNQVDYVLYSDSVGEKQEYMVPHYRLKSKNDQDLEIILPAIDYTYINLK